MTIGVGYGDNLSKAKEVIEAVIAADERVLKDPASVVAVANLGDSSVDFVVRPWVNAADFWGFKFDFTQTIKSVSTRRVSAYHFHSATSTSSRRRVLKYAFYHTACFKTAGIPAVFLCAVVFNELSERPELWVIRAAEQTVEDSLGGEHMCIHAQQLCQYCLAILRAPLAHRCSRKAG